MKTLKEKLKARDLVKGMHTTLCDSSVTEMCGMVGFDFIWIDTEHTAIDYHTLACHITAARAAGTNSLVRIPWNDAVLAKRVLELGVDGIVFPVINTVEELDYAMQSTLYPPYGTRGFGPIRAADYGLLEADQYIHEKSLNLVRCVQIESYKAVDNLPQMVKNPWVDCFIFGPCDLSGSIGQLNKVMEKDTQDLIKRSISILKDAGKSIGVSTGARDQQTIEFWYNLGVNVLSAGMDYLHIVWGAKEVYSILSNLK